MQIEQINNDAGRIYQITTESTKIKLPSITTLLSKYEPKDGLKQWQENIGKEEADRIKNNSANKGNIIHRLAENKMLAKSVNTVLIDEISDSNILNSFSNLEKILNHVEPLYVEEPCYWEEPYGFMDDETIGFAGTCDLCGVIDGGLLIDKESREIIPNEKLIFVGDYKTWNKAKYPKQQNRNGQHYYPLIKYCLQLAAYCKALNFNKKQNIKNAFIFGLPDNSREPYIYYLNEEKLLFYWKYVYLMCQAYFNKTEFYWSEIEENSNFGYLPQRLELKS